MLYAIEPFLILKFSSPRKRNSHVLVENETNCNSLTEVGLITKTILWGIVRNTIPYLAEEHFI